MRRTSAGPGSRSSCLVYDWPLPDEGLTWDALVDWWATETLHETNLHLGAQHLYKRCRSPSIPGPSARCCGSMPAATAGSTAARRGAAAAGLPALRPYLRPDPQRRRDAVVRQRMDFLLLLPGRRRVVLEVDGRQHYATDDGAASTSRYAQMVREDRRLRLAGYEVYRFGGAEFTGDDRGQTMLEDFFTRLLDDPPTGL